MTRTSPLTDFLNAVDSPWILFDEENWKIDFMDEYGYNIIWITENYDEIREQLFAEFMGWVD